MQQRFSALIGALLLVSILYLNFPTNDLPSALKFPIPWIQPPMSFVARNATNFVDRADGSIVYVNGWNSYWLLASDSREAVREMLRRGREMGMTVCRTWAFNDGGVNALQKSPGVFDERRFQAIASRKNSYSGVRYSDEPAIFAWELMNEPRCATNSSGPILQAWISEMASYIKSLDEKHLVTVGLEGFYGSGRAERLSVNPGDWAASLGSDFIQNSAVEDVDFASVHVYPDSWLPKASLEEKLKHLSTWVDSHINDSEHVLKKPVLFSEVGSRFHMIKNETEDDIFLKTVYDKVYESAKRREAGAGALIWQLMIEGMQSYEDNFSLVARQHQSTYKLIMKQSCRLRYLFKKNAGTNTEVGQACLEGLP